MCLMHQACYDIRRLFELVNIVYSIISFGVLIKYLKIIKHNCSIAKAVVTAELDHHDQPGLSRSRILSE